MQALGQTYSVTKKHLFCGRTVACDGIGRAYGPPELVEMVRENCRRDAASPPDGQTALDRIGTWLVWLGVVMLVMFGPDR